MVTKGQILVDVGCDHGYVPICLVGDGICPSALACDVRPGPLARAEENIRAAGLTDRIKTVLADGVPDAVRGFISGGEKATLLIAGMGGKLIRDILSDAGELLSAFDEMVLSPHKDAAEVRLAACELGFGIDAEDAFFDEGKYYQVIKLRRDREVRELSRGEAEWGPLLIGNGNGALYTYLGSRLETLSKIKERLSEARDMSRLDEVEREIAGINETRLRMSGK